MVSIMRRVYQRCRKLWRYSAFEFSDTTRGRAFHKLPSCNPLRNVLGFSRSLSWVKWEFLCLTESTIQLSDRCWRVAAIMRGMDAASGWAWQRVRVFGHYEAP